MTIEEAATRLVLEPAALAGWESGEDAPTFPRLERLAALYKRPLATFYLDSIPIERIHFKEFRKPGGSDVEEYSLPFETFVRRTTLQKNWASAIHGALRQAEPIKEIPVCPSWDFARSAHEIRECLGITFEAQVGWKDEAQAFRAWRTQIEHHGVLVVHNDPISEKVPIEIFRGFANYGSQFSIIALNSSDSINGRIFSLIHEFIHILITKNGLEDKKKKIIRQPKPEHIEIVCNGVSGQVLVPADKLTADLANLNKAFDDWSTEDLFKLAKRYSVSSEVILNRLKQMDLVSEPFYDQTKSKIRSIYEEIALAKSKDRNGAPAYSTMVLRRNGRRFSRLVFKANDQGKLTTSELSDCLGVKVNHLAKIKSALVRGGE